MTPRVSVLMIAYNEAEFIAQAIESALMQQIEGGLEIVIGDDCSTDGTREIVAGYAERHPQVIRALLHPRNLGPHVDGLRGKHNLVAVYKACRGQYIAVLEGDDFWNHPLKLQRQAAFLDAHPECSLCFHPVDVVYSGGRVDHWGPVFGKSPAEITTVETLLGIYDGLIEIPTPSLMLRAGLVPEFPAWFYEVFSSDFAIEALHADRGKLGFVPDRMATHRKHPGGVSTFYDTNRDYCLEMQLRLLRHLDREFGYRYHQLLRRPLAAAWEHLAMIERRRCRRIASLVAHWKHLECREAKIGDRIVKTLEFGEAFRTARLIRKLI